LHILYSIEDKRTENDQLKRAWKEDMVVNFKVLTQHLSGGTE